LGRLKRRLQLLKAGLGASPEGHEGAVGRETLRRMTDEELDAYEAAIERQVAGEAPTEEDRAIAERAEAIGGEVAREHETSA